MRGLRCFLCGFGAIAKKRPFRPIVCLFFIMLGLTSHKTKTNKLENDILIQHFIMLHAATLLLLVLVVLSVCVVSTVQATGLTAENFDAQTEGKTVFLKFYAPWCGHCKSMAPDWDKLMTEYADHAVALVGEVDCTNDANDQICEEFDVQVSLLVWN